MAEDTKPPLGARLTEWHRDAQGWGLLPHERDAATAVAGLMAGALAVAVDVLERPSEAAVLAAFHQICMRADAPSEVDVRTMH